MDRSSGNSRCSRFLLRINVTLRWKNRLPGDTSLRSPLYPLPDTRIVGYHCNFLFMQIIKWETVEETNFHWFIIATREIDH